MNIEALRVDDRERALAFAAKAASRRIADIREVVERVDNDLISVFAALEEIEALVTQDD